ncbi:spermidine synthase [Nocardioides acrostichi]|uniref:Fused MFS/spermidine synthase n=1 Tax=Nocardioides acrostichi TaxID=2784339 RepID=A0A930V3R5_9ACTN|nr:fused MFS/spermidine synthase [Nocardioides acrostichi]MBF4163454.1 fused MFS/spermidine synthase [Nocardioides acrostichi]
MGRRSAETDPSRPGRGSSDATAHVVLEADAAGGVTVVVDETPQSHVRLDDPSHLEFGYIRHLALLLGTRVPAAPAPLGVTHVGGAAMTLARWVQHTRPGSPQIVFEPDAALTDLVRAELPLPRGHRIRVRPVDGLAGTAALRPESADAVVLDAYASGSVPSELTTPDYLGDVARVLRPTGVLGINLATASGLVPRVLAGLLAIEAYVDLAVIGPREVLRGRPGNVVVAAARDALDAGALRAAMSREPLPSEVRHGAEVARLAGAASPAPGRR